MKQALFVLLLTIGFASQVTADPLPRAVPIRLTTAYIPAGFDSNDNAQIIIEGYLPDTCHKVGSRSIKFDPRQNLIIIEQNAYVYNGVCRDVTVQFHEVLNLGIMAPNQYRIQDGVSRQILGTLPIRTTLNPEPDETLYAPVSDAFVTLNENGQSFLTIVGHFTNNCLRFTQVRMNLETKNVLTILPQVEFLGGASCREGYYPFKEVRPLPTLPRGRYLMHVRAMSGQSINKLFDVGRR